MQPDAAAFYRALGSGLKAANASAWRTNARPSQLPPEGNWRIWLLLAGRGFGKTRAGAEWVRGLVESGNARRVALVAATAADARDVLIEGASGIMSISPNWARPTYEPSRRRIIWPNGATATCFSADEPERLRGPQFDAAWVDELGTWRYADAAWDNLMLGLRLGTDPRCVVTTTPRPTRIIRALVKRAGEDVVLTRGSTFENRANLAPQFLAEIVSRYAGTRLGRQELEAEILDDAPGALWQRSKLEELRVAAAPALRRIVVAIDPAATSGEDADETGIVVAGIADDGHGFVIEDLSGRYAPHEWARRAIAAYERHGADRIVAESNQGGEMVEATIRSINGDVAFRAVHASRGKAVRAEPISALYEQGRVHHVGAFPALEDQMCAFTSDFERSRGGSPDRLDALVWALTELMTKKISNAGLLDWYEAEAKKSGATIPGPRYGYTLSPRDADPGVAGVRMKVKPGVSSIYGIDGRQIPIGADGTFIIAPDQLANMKRAGHTQFEETENAG